MNIRKQQGFTIIEVVLVLAIAGLIFLMVFIALPTLQRNQRDTQRRDDLSRFKAQINQYQANNKGGTPTSFAAAACGAAATGNVTDFVARYMQNWKDPQDGNDYPCVGNLATFNSATDAGTWYYQQNGKCSGETIVAASGTREYAVVMKLEGSGVSCQDNQ
jgi:prepilin-type N-terminal cleavage/methylation domain-containing protein